MLKYVKNMKKVFSAKQTLFLPENVFCPRMHIFIFTFQFCNSANLHSL